MQRITNCTGNREKDVFGTGKLMDNKWQRIKNCRGKREKDVGGPGKRQLVINLAALCIIHSIIPTYLPPPDTNTAYNLNAQLCIIMHYTFNYTHTPTYSHRLTKINKAYNLNAQLSDVYNSTLYIQLYPRSTNTRDQHSIQSKCTII